MLRRRRPVSLNMWHNDTEKLYNFVRDFDPSTDHPWIPLTTGQ